MSSKPFVVSSQRKIPLSDIWNSRIYGNNCWNKFSKIEISLVIIIIWTSFVVLYHWIFTRQLRNRYVRMTLETLPCHTCFMQFHCIMFYSWVKFTLDNRVRSLRSTRLPLMTSCIRGKAIFCLNKFYIIRVWTHKLSHVSRFFLITFKPLYLSKLWFYTENL